MRVLTRKFLQRQGLSTVLAVMAVFTANVSYATNVQVNGLFSGSAVVTIDGKQRLLKQGMTSAEGVKLISATSKQAVLEFNGERHTLGISQQISSGFQKAEIQQTRIPVGRGGHYFTSGQVNGRRVDFLIDTGATHLAFNKQTAIDLGINFRAGKASSASTANGVVPIFIVNLESVSVGGVTVHNVSASVHLDGSPSIALLGNSFLKQVDMSTENGVLLLSTSR